MEDTEDTEKGGDILEVLMLFSVQGFVACGAV